MAMVSSFSTSRKMPQVFCRKKEKERGGQNNYPYKVIEISPPPKNLGIRCFPSNLQCGESVMIEGQTYTISAVTHRYQLRKGKYEPSEKRLDCITSSIAFESLHHVKFPFETTSRILIARTLFFWKPVATG
ncbi:hypothetical protein Salat_2193700 [Sesamum alatum]|uniref:Uncharacterized protein n=1 Tax=Sesamum alatum TaxID=300844 RepID=A0AAE1XTJ1_9LAMI|nr:hypothetical protein Salat_2193700 [Sesamum alatum]